MEFAKRMERFGTGVFSVLAQKKKERLEAGGEVIDLSIGAPNIPPAEHIRKALAEAVMDEKNYVYAISDLEELQDAAACWYRKRYQVKLDPKTEIAALLGSQEGLTHLALTIVDEGETVLVPDPCYPAFADGAKLAGADLYYMPEKEENGYLIDLEQIPQEVADAAKLMVVSYPNNPTAAMATEEFYGELIAFAKAHDIIVLYDNAYSELVFDGRTCGSFLSYPGAKEVGVEFNSLSKTYGLAGARIGFCLGNSQVVEKLKALKSNLDYGMFLPIQKAAIAAITGDQSCVEATRKAYEKRRDILCEGLTRIGWKVDKCPATMFVWAKIPENFRSSEEFVWTLLEKAGVLVTPGNAFGPSGEGYVRLALVQDEAAMKKAIANMESSQVLKM
ncbi:MAG: aminotransferase class I/II-fold pyridoxal phosphate-dependent enzyme [Blautia sp.]|jgi:LL-diaminopimelate aminotransferase